MFRSHSPAGKEGVLFINSPTWPGADTFIHAAIMRGLDRSRFEVHVACSAGPRGARTPAFAALEKIPNLHILASNFGSSLTGRSRPQQAVHLLSAVPALVHQARLVWYIRRHGISVLHSTDRPRDAVSCVMLGKLSGAKSIVHVHVKCADWISRGVRRAFKRADALIGVSEFVSRSLIDCGYPAEKTHTVLNAIDLAEWDYHLDPGLVRRELGIPEGAPVIACAARIFKGKGQDDVIRAVAAVRSEFPTVRLLIVGRDDRQAMRTSFTAELKTLTQELGLSDNVIFTGHRSDMPALFAASDIFALPSFEEPFGLVYAEAMAMKRPVLALNNGGAPEVVEHGKSGLLSTAFDRDALVANLLTLLRDPALRKRMGEYGRQQVETRFTLDRMARDVERVYASMAPAWSRDSIGLEHQVRL